MRGLAVLSVLFLSLAVTNAYTQFNYVFNSLEPYSYRQYFLGYLESETTVEVKLKTPGTGIP
jgi:hypothetical protein